MAFPHKKIAARLVQGDTATTAKDKGDALEDVLQMTFCSLPGVSVLRRNFVDSSGGMEIDLLLYNNVRLSPVSFLPEFVLVECKNWATKVNSATVRDFIGKLRACKLTVGILVAANGITGDPRDQTAANDIIRQAFDSDSIKVLLIKRTDIEAFRSTDQIIVFTQERFGDVILRSVSIA